MRGAAGRSRQLSESTIADYRGVLFGGAGGRDQSRCSMLARPSVRAAADRGADDLYWLPIIDDSSATGRCSRIATYLCGSAHLHCGRRI
jgi:hypothetical protein